MADGGSTFGFCPTDTLALICVKANSMKLIASLKYLNMYARCQNGPHLSLPPKSASCMRWRRCSGSGPLSLHAALSATVLPPSSLVNGVATYLLGQKSFFTWYVKEAKSALLCDLFFEG